MGKGSRAQLRQGSVTRVFTNGQKSHIHFKVQVFPPSPFLRPVTKLVIFIIYCLRNGIWERYITRI